MKKRTLKIGIASGKYRVKPYEPKIWFTSKSSLAQALNNKNHILFNMIKN